jgi:hypothetical protein
MRSSASAASKVFACPGRPAALTGLIAWEVTVAILEREGTRIRAVRGVFAEGAPAFPGSFLSEGFHVQVAVRDVDLITNVDLVPDGFRGVTPPPRRTANPVCPVVDPADAGQAMRRYFESVSEGDLIDEIRRAAPQPEQVGRLRPSRRPPG